MVRKVTVSVPDELLARIDAEAVALGVSRSEIVQEASAHYLSQTAEERARAALVARRKLAIQRMAEIGAGSERDPRSSLEIIKEGRCFQGAPLWGSPERAAWEEAVGYARWREEMGFDVDDAGV